MAAEFCLLQTDGHLLPLRDASLGCIICFQVFPHFDDKVRVLSELRRVLRPGGLLLVLHLMDHHGLNALHRSAGREISSDRIWPAETLAENLRHYGFENELVREESDLYLVRARRLQSV